MVEMKRGGEITDEIEVKLKDKIIEPKDEPLKVPERWLRTGLEFEYQVSKVFNDMNYHIYGEHPFEMMRNIQDLPPSKGGVSVKRSCDLVTTKFYHKSMGKRNFNVSLQFIIECKHGNYGNILFLPTFKTEQENSRNISLIVPNPTGIDLEFQSSFRKYQWSSIPSLGKGVSLKNNEEFPYLENGLKQSCMAALDVLSRILAKNDPGLRYYGDQDILIPYEMYNIFPIIVTKCDLWVRDFTHSEDVPQPDSDMTKFFTKVPYGMIHFFPKNDITNFFIQSIQKYLEVTNDPGLIYTLNEIEKYLIPSRCLITTYKHLEELLTTIEYNFIDQCQVDIRTFLGKQKALKEKHDD